MALLIGLGWCALWLAACTVEPGPGARDASTAQKPNCQGQTDACVERCKQAAPDQASRQPCYNDCMRQARCP